MKMHLCDECTHDVNMDMRAVAPKKYITKSKIKQRSMYAGRRHWNDCDIKENLGAPDILGINTGGGYGYSKNNVQIYLLTRVEYAEREAACSRRRQHV